MLTANAVSQTGNYEKQYMASFFDSEVFEKAEALFEEYRANGVILNNSFADMEWRLTNQLQNTTISFWFNELAYHKNAAPWIGCGYDLFIKSIKAYAMLKMGSATIASIRERVNSFRLFAELAEDALIGGVYDCPIHMAEFLTLLPGEDARRDAIIESLDEMSWANRAQERKSQQRVLADFDAYFRFSDTMLTFWASADDVEKLFWFPLYLWWTLTAILPLRTTEFLLTPRRCLNTENGNNLITLRRTTLKGGNRKIAYRIDKDYEAVRYVIPQKMAGEIKWYLDATDTTTPTSLSTLFVREPHYARFKREPPDYLGYYTYSNLSTCLRLFQEEIIGVGKERHINLGDTRHLAMISLVLSGGSPLICKELAGHSDINISSNYYSNISGFIKCAVYEMHLKSRAGTAEMTERGTPVLMKPNRRVTVPDGFCDSVAYVGGDISDCIKSIGADGELGHCRRCPFFIDGYSGMRFLYAFPQESKEQVDKDSQYLLEMLETVRRGIGLQEDIQSAILRLQHSGARYARCLQNELEENGYGKTEKTGD